MKYLRLTLLVGFIAAAAGLLLLGPRDPEPSWPRVVAGFLHRSTAVTTGPSPTIVTYWEKWTGNEGAQMGQIVDGFNRTVGKEKNIRVKYLSVSSVNEKTLVATAAGVPPDVAGVWDGQVPQFAALDALEPLDELATAVGMTASYYKPVYWKGCTYEGKLYGLISTPAAVALHYNKRIFRENAVALRAAGLDPDRPPRTLDELDRYAEVLDIVQRDKDGRVKSIKRSGYLPMEPGWFMAYTCYWFGGDIYDPATRRFTLTDPKVVAAYEWIKRYSLRLGGPRSMNDFRSGMGGFNSPLNPFLAGTVVMEQQGPWMANYIEDLKPSLNRWEMSKDEEWRKLRAGELSPEERRRNYEWGAAPFPAAIAGIEGVTFAGFDVLVIPRYAKHKREAFEFIAYVNRQEVMEKLCMLHCKNSPLAKVSGKFLREHPNPYIEVFERMASSPNAKGIPPIPIWPEVGEELGFVAQKVYLLSQEPAEALKEAQLRLQKKLDRYYERQGARRGGVTQGVP